MSKASRMKCDHVFDIRTLVCVNCGANQRNILADPPLIHGSSPYVEAQARAVQCASGKHTPRPDNWACERCGQPLVLD